MALVIRIDLAEVVAVVSSQQFHCQMQAAVPSQQNSTAVVVADLMQA